MESYFFFGLAVVFAAVLAAGFFGAGFFGAGFFGGTSPSFVLPGLLPVHNVRPVGRTR
ncbi:MAG: hypothetical protein ACXWH0_08845 [Acidimicrobiia bacterium]